MAHILAAFKGSLMLKKFILFQLIICVFCISLKASPSLSSYADISISSQQEIGEQFKTVRDQIEQRWDAFQKNRKFKLFEIGKPDAALAEEFAIILKIREYIWTTPGFEVAEHLIINNLVRAPGCVAFDFNNTVPNFNASTICLKDKIYFACEGPRSKDIPSFFKLLTTHRVTHLVRLTAPYEGETKKCHPYWEGLLTESSDGAGYLNIPMDTGIYSIRAFKLVDWRDHHGIDPDQLLALVLRVRGELRDTESLLAVHCSAGVGRTGTFLAALAIVDAIDGKEPFSIEEIVFRLSLQRVHSVAKLDQYITLHRLAENYLKKRSIKLGD